MSVPQNASASLVLNQRGPQSFHFPSPIRNRLWSSCHCVWILGSSASCQEALSPIRTEQTDSPSYGSSISLRGQEWTVAHCPLPWLLLLSAQSPPLPLWAIPVPMGPALGKPLNFSGTWLSPSKDEKAAKDNVDGLWPLFHSLRFSKLLDFY